MSERGSFVTEYIYCPKCFEEVKSVLLKRDKHLNSVVIPPWSDGGEDLPIIAGKIGGMYPGQECVDMEQEYGTDIESAICHSVRIAVLCENGESRVINLEPRRPAES